jgi:hypothetical protein
MVPIRIRDDLSNLLCIFRCNQIYLRHFSKAVKVLCEVFVADLSDESVVVVYITSPSQFLLSSALEVLKNLPDHLDRAVNTDALSLEVFAKSSEEAQSDFLVEHV